MYNAIKGFFERRKFSKQGRSSEWKDLRDSFILREKVCGYCMRQDKDMEVHHITPFHVAPELELEEDNLIVLCKKCHLVQGHYGNFKLWNPDIKLHSANYADNKARFKEWDLQQTI